MKSSPLVPRLLLTILILGGLTGVFAVPKAPSIQESALRMSLPSILPSTGWEGGPDETNFTKEREALAADTEFRRRSYYRGSRNDDGTPAIELLQATLVLGGHDVNNSLHRPERCLPAQGFQIRETASLPVSLSDGRVMHITRLTCEGTDIRKGRSFTHLNYYFFVGHDSVTGSHYGRTFSDMRDRLLSGYDQRWAYVTVSTSLIEGSLRDDTGQEISLKNHSVEETDRIVQQFISELVPDIVDTGSIRNWK